MGRRPCSWRLAEAPPRLAAALAATLAAALLAAACAAPAPTSAPEPSPAPEIVPAPEPPVPEPPPEPVYGNFDRETLYELLVAELSLRRGDFAPAVDRYASEALRTRDPGVVAKAARLAAVTGDAQRARELGLLWAHVAPGDPQARRAAAVALLEAGEFEAALGHLRALRELGASADFRALGASLEEVDPAARGELLRALAALQESWPGDDQLRWARAALLEEAGRAAEALVVLDAEAALRLGGEALLLRARLLEAEGDPEAAVSLLADALERDGREARLRYRLARLLIDTRDLAGARTQFEQLLTTVGDNAEVLLSLALIDLELDQLAASRAWLERLLRADRRPDTARYFLGVVAERSGDVSAALDAWSRVTPGFEFTRAQGAAAELILRSAGAAELRDYLDALRARHEQEGLTLWLLEGQALLDAEQPAAAVRTLTEALALHAGRAELLYARAMAHDANGSFADFESDLSALLELDPDDAMALNALGYTLADRTDRLEEARRLVERALELAPDEPAYVDSLGWIEFRSGNHARALELLESAFAGLSDPEVAAHLGEALWVVGDRERALSVWRTGLGLPQTTDVLRQTLERLLTPAERAALEADA
ncbi:MAG: tetratricopeptide repeat protein [Pseudomonadales bacterium]|nr:tetratricopeptide repeat protein [Pseudomonadales bacterium]